jgi:hypothetical protein
MDNDSKLQKGRLAWIANYVWINFSMIVNYRKASMNSKLRLNKLLNDNKTYKFHNLSAEISGKDTLALARKISLSNCFAQFLLNCERSSRTHLFVRSQFKRNQANYFDDEIPTFQQIFILTFSSGGTQLLTPAVPSNPIKYLLTQYAIIHIQIIQVPFCWRQTES